MPRNAIHKPSDPAVQNQRHRPASSGRSSNDDINLASAHALARQLQVDGYLKARVLPDGSVAALLQLIYTRAICLGCTREAWSRRFCFQDPALAESEFLALQGEDDTPSGFIAQR